MDQDAMSGLAIMQALVDGSMPHPSMADTMGFRQIEVSEGCARFRARADERHLNPAGTVHGGYGATLLDSVLGNAVHTRLEAGAGYVTVDLDVKMLAPIPLGEDIYAEAKVVRVTRRIGVAEGRIVDARDNILVLGTSTCVIFRPR
jgi:uncharacterized protein (TIGR00369 family)